MKPSSLIGHSAELVRIMIKSPLAPDSIAKQYLREKKYIGSRERKAISELSFAYLRLRYLAEGCSVTISDDSSTDDFLNVAAAVAIVGFVPDLEPYRQQLLHSLNYAAGTDEPTLTDYANHAVADRYPTATFDVSFAEEVIDRFRSLDEEFSVCTTAQLSTISDEALSRSAARLSAGTYFIAHLLANGFTLDRIKEITDNLMLPAELCLRTNSDLVSPAELVSRLADAGHCAKISTLSPIGIVVSGRPRLDESDEFKAGYFDIQDVGSQLISYALSPTNSSDVLDACAGAGGKSLHLAMLAGSNSRITSTDIEYNRLKEIQNRANRMGIRNIKPALIKSNDLKAKQNRDLYAELRRGFDYVLVDAPCTGSGTTRRNPLPKYRITSKLVEKINRAQLGILEQYAEFVRDGGFLVYSTCSILPAENELVCRSFLARNPNFEPDPLEPVFAIHGIELPGLDHESNYLTLYPETDSSDGFFMARFRKVPENEI